MDKSHKLVKADCEELLGRFRKTDSVRFEIFSKIWREMKFSEIFYGTTRRKNREFCRLILDTATEFFLPPFSFQIRVGGLYLLYSLYQCQTPSSPQQIRLALKDWDDVKKFEKDAVDARHLDVVYIFQKLMFQKAFLFTAMPSLLTFKKKRKMEKSALCQEFIERACRPQELINIEVLEEMSNIHGLYEKLKTSAALTSDASGSSVNLINKDLVPQLRSTVVDYYKWQQWKGGTVEEEDSGEGTSSQQQCSDRADRLAAIKSKAFGQAAEAAKSRRHRQVEMDLTNNEARPSKTIRSTKQPSLKARTTQNVHISGDILNEASSITLINRLTTLDYDPKEEPKKKNMKMKYR